MTQATPSPTASSTAALQNTPSDTVMAAQPVPPTAGTSSTKGILMSETALNHVKALREKQGSDLCLRVGVRQGGCSGMSYMMDFESADNIGEHDEVYDYDGFQVVCDRKSLLYLYGLMLDYSDALIGGGFQFTNPNANQTCGCGKSFGT